MGGFFQETIHIMFVVLQSLLGIIYRNMAMKYWEGSFRQYTTRTAKRLIDSR